MAELSSSTRTAKVAALQTSHQSLMGVLSVAGPRGTRGKGAVLSETSLVSILDLLPLAGALLQADGRLMGENAEFAELMSVEGPFSVKGGVLRARSPADQLRLLRMLDGEGPRRGTFGATQAGANLTAITRPLKASDSGLHLLLLLEEGPQLPLSPATVAQRFGLTIAEARVAVSLAAGLRLSDICFEQGRSIHTLRTHLKRALMKTGSRTQAELVLQLLS